jgi:hypothetical protein
MAKEHAVTAGSSLAKLQELKKRHDEQSKNKGHFVGGTERKYLPWFPKMETSQKAKVRILPLEDNNGLPFIMVRIHKGLFPEKWKSIVCPKSVGESECPVCDYVFQNYKEAQEADDENLKNFYKLLMPKDQIYVIIYNRQTNQVEKMAISNTMFGQILSEIEKEDITDIWEGYDGKITCAVTQKGGKSYSFSLSEVKTPLADTDDEAQAIMDKVVEYSEDVERLRKPSNPEFVQKLLNKLSGEESTEEEEEEPAGDADDLPQEEVAKATSVSAPPASEMDEDEAQVQAMLDEEKKKKDAAKAAPEKAKNGTAAKKK